MEESQIVEKFCLLFYGAINGDDLSSELFVSNIKVKSVTVYNSCIELVESIIPSSAASTNICLSEPTSKDVVCNLAKRFIFISFPLQRKYEVISQNLLAVCVIGRVLTKEPKYFGVFRHYIKFAVVVEGDSCEKQKLEGSTFVIESIISEIVCSEKVKESGKTVEAYFQQ